MVDLLNLPFYYHNVFLLLLLLDFFKLAAITSLHPHRHLFTFFIASSLHIRRECARSYLLMWVLSCWTSVRSCICAGSWHRSLSASGDANPPGPGPDSGTPPSVWWPSGDPLGSSYFWQTLTESGEDGRLTPGSTSIYTYWYIYTKVISSYCHFDTKQDQNRWKNSKKTVQINKKFYSEKNLSHYFPPVNPEMSFKKNKSRILKW